MNGRKKRILALALALALASLACAFAEEAPEASQTRRLRLGSSVYTVLIDDDFVAGELTEADVAAGQIGCYQDDDTGMELDLFQFAKEGDAASTLDHYALERAEREAKVEAVWPNDAQNDIDVAWYSAEDGEARKLIAYFLDSGDSYVELCFYLPDSEDTTQVWATMDSLDYMRLKQISVGVSRFTMLVPDDYMQGQISDEDAADDQVAYWYSDATLMDFDIYQFSKEGQAPTIAEYAETEAATYPEVSELVTDGEINRIPVAWYRCVDECDEGEYDTITYVFEDGADYFEIVFWLDGPTAEAEADFIIHNLIDESLAE